MLRFVVFSCCVVTSMCAADDFLNCGENAEMKCVHPCPPQTTCRNRGIQYDCKEPDQPCQNICICKPGYFRNAVGDCISNEDCDMCQRENEYFACDSACDNECDKLATQNRTHCPIKNFVCNRKCYCEDGFARNDKGDCIPVEKCHSKNVAAGSSKVPKDKSRVRRSSDLAGCGKNAEKKCVQPCPPQKTCENRDVQYSCLQVVEPCHHICACKPGYLRNAVGDCVTNEECDRKNVKGVSSKVSKEKFRVRRRSDLADPICTGENEVHTDCRKSCPPNTCLSLVARFKCDSHEPCRKGCICKPGYLRQTPTSPCIPICQCTQMEHSADCKTGFITKE